MAGTPGPAAGPRTGSPRWPTATTSMPSRGASPPATATRPRPQPARGFTKLGHAALNCEHIVTVVPGVIATALQPTCDAGVEWPQLQVTGTHPDGTALQISGVIIFSVRDGALPSLVLCLDPAALAPDVLQAPGDRPAAAADQDQAPATAERLAMTRLPGRLASTTGDRKSTRLNSSHRL